MPKPILPTIPPDDGFVRIRGAREHNLQNISVDIPRNSLVVFTGVSGSGKSSLAFGTLYAEAQRRYLESVSPYARRLFHQMSTPDVDEITGLPPAVALQQQRGSPTTRSSVGSVTTLSNLLRMLYSRAGHYPPGQPIIYAEGFSPNTPQGACPTCHGLGRIYDATENSMVPDPTKSIRDRAIAAWPLAWGGQNQRDIVTTLGIDVDTPWKNLPKKTRHWLLFTNEQPQVPVYASWSLAEVKSALKRKEPPSYMGTFTGAKKYVLQTFATTQSALMKKRVAQYIVSSDCPTCHGKRLRPEALSIKFAGMDIADLSRLPLKQLATLIAPYANQSAPALKALLKNHPEKAEVTHRIAEDLQSRLATLLDLGLGYLSLERSTPTLSPGELQRLRLATQVRSNLFGVVYVLDEPCAGLHPADTQNLLHALDHLKSSGNSLFVVEHDLDVIRHADWIVDVGPLAGQQGGQILYSGPLKGLQQIKTSHTAHHLFPPTTPSSAKPTPSGVGRIPHANLTLQNLTRNNLQNLSISFPLGVMTTVTGVSGSGKSSLVSQSLVDLVCAALGHNASPPDADDDDPPKAHGPRSVGSSPDPANLESSPLPPTTGHITSGLEHIKRLVNVDQKPIGRTPRSNLATYTGLFDHIRHLFASTKQARSRHYSPGRFSFNVKAGRCENCQGEGFVMVELLFLPSVYSPCPVCHATRYNSKTLEITYNNKNIADILNLTVDAAHTFFQSPRTAVRGSPHDPLLHPLTILKEVGLGYLRLGQPATELSGGEAQRIKLATELQRSSSRGQTLYILDEPTTGLHPHDVEKLLTQLSRLVSLGNTVILVEHDMRVVAASDHVIDIGPGAGDEGGQIIAQGPPHQIASSPNSRTAPFLAAYLNSPS